MVGVPEVVEQQVDDEAEEQAQLEQVEGQEGQEGQEQARLEEVEEQEGQEQGLELELEPEKACIEESKLYMSLLQSIMIKSQQLTGA